MGFGGRVSQAVGKTPSCVSRGGLSQEAQDEGFADEEEAQEEDQVGP